MGEWKKCKLGEAPIEIIDGDRGKNYPKKNEFFANDYCIFLNIKNVTTNGFAFAELNFITREKDALLRKGRLKRGDVVLTTRGTVGNVGFYDQSVPFDNIRINSGMVIIRPKGIDENFNYQLFKYLKKDFETFATGSAQPQLPIRDLRAMFFSLPPFPEQKAIASVLSSLDDKIALLHRQNKTLEAMAETLFRQWFVEEAQDDWQDGVIADLIEFNPQRKLAKGQIVPYLEMAALSTSTFAPTGWYNREFKSGTKFINGDTLLARITPCLENGKTAYVTFLEDDQVAWGSTEYIVMRPKGGLHPFFAYTLARNTDFREYAEGCLEGSSGRQRVNVDHLKNYDIKLPSPAVITQFNAVAESVVQKLHQNSKQIQTLEKLRDTLLPKLMSGEVRVEYEN